MKVLFIAMSHELTQDQIEGFEHQYCSYQIDDNGDMVPCSYEGTRVVTLKSVTPELQAQASNINPKASLEEIQELAASIVRVAVTEGATHFCFQGEPALQFWANLYAIGLYSYWETGETVLGTQGKPSKLIPVQSTTQRVSSETQNPDGTVSKTSVFKHVQWRILF